MPDRETNARDDADAAEARADALKRALRQALNRMNHVERWRNGEANSVPVCRAAIEEARAALDQQPAEQPETLEAQSHKARGEPLADQPATAERDQDQARFERAQTQLVYSLADHYALEVTDEQARSIAREVLQAAATGTTANVDTHHCHRETRSNRP